MAEAPVTFAGLLRRLRTGLQLTQEPLEIFQWIGAVETAEVVAELGTLGVL